MIDWDKEFREAHLTSGPGRPSLQIQNVNPKPSAGSRNIFDDDEKEIIRAALKHGFTLYGDRKAKIIQFIKLDG